MALAATTPYSRSRALWQIFILYITTCGLYFFYWFYKTSQDLYDNQPNMVKPLWRTLGLLVPLLNIYLLWKLFSDIKKRCAQARIAFPFYPSLVTLIFILCSALYRLPNLFSFLGFSSVLPVLLVQNTLNQYWQKEEAPLTAPRKFSIAEILICLIGTTLLTLAVIGAGLTPSE
jgi:hypothetical protein